MRFGCCLNMVASNPDGTGREHLRTLKESGFDYAELPLAEMMALSDESFRALGEDLKRYAIACEVCNNFFPGTIRLTGPDADLTRVMPYVRQAMERAGSLGVKRVVFGSGKAKNVPDGFSMKRGYEQIVALLQAVSPIADAQGITIVIEPLRQAECNLINTFREGCCLARDVNCKNISVLVDFYHLTVEKESPAVLCELGPQFLQHVHFANPTGRVYPLHKDEADYLPFIHALHTAGYDQRISCEAYTNDFQKHAPLAQALMNTICHIRKEFPCNTVKN